MTATGTAVADPALSDPEPAILAPSDAARHGGVTPLRNALTTRGKVLFAGGVVLVAVGIWLRYPELTALGCAGFAADAVALAAVARTPALRVERSVEPQSVQRGGTATATVRVRNESRWRLPELAARDVAGPGRVPFKVPALAGFGTDEGTVALPTGRRGVVTSGPLLVDRSDPFGLALRTLDTGLAGELYVRPRAIPVPQAATSMARSADGPQSETTAQGTLAFHALREYVPGDEPRHVHWRATAHAGHLMVKQHVDTSHAAFAVVLDVAVPASASAPSGRSRSGGASSVEFAESFEAAVDCAASIACTAAGQGHPLILLDSHGRNLLAAGGLRRTGRSPEEVLDALTPITAEPADAVRDEELSMVLRSLAAGGRGSLATLVTTRSLEPWAVPLQALGSAYARVTAVHVVPEGEPVPEPRRLGRISWLTLSRAGDLPAALTRAWTS
jgi:uncharacterized protein (DUF58 family)